MISEHPAINERTIKQKRRKGASEEEVKKIILQTASEMFRNNGYYGTTIADISTLLRLSKSSIYHYWPEKQDLLFEIHRSAHEQLYGRLEAIANNGQPTVVRMYQAVANHIEFACSERSPTTGALQQEHALKNRYKRAIVRLRDRYDVLLREIIVDGIKEGLFAANDPKLLSFVIIGAANYTQHWYSPKGRMSREEMIKGMTDILMGGILRRETQGNTPQTTEADKAPAFVELSSGNP